MDAVSKSARRRVSIRRERVGPWRERLWLPDGREMLLRPIEPTDAEALREGFARLSPEEVRMRFLHPITELTPAYAEQLCATDPASAFALVVCDPQAPGAAAIGAVARLAIDRARNEADFALIVGRELGQQGLGTYLIKKLIEHARRRRLDALVGDVLEENTTMLSLCERLGFTRHAMQDEPGMVRVRKALKRNDP